MKVDFTKSFDKQFTKLTHKRQEQAKAAVALFLHDALHPVLRNHALRGEWKGYHSISAGGDLRLHFKMVDENTALFVAAGSHSQLYK
ncbi:MAG TPA: type II toxin-antitoxin system mRNA interferase toxin, RelE/StbE family [Candidatus Saccharimonadia bacterium]|nr:type II toxin-antitoxin system mRNA interferase toxin, RelE/StbE family [Candidatus Saccharimonadia bacterium]